MAKYQKTTGFTEKQPGKSNQILLDQWTRLEGFLLDDRLEISNNRAERAIKPFVIVRKNFLFSKSSKGATASAIIYSEIKLSGNLNNRQIVYL